MGSNFLKAALSGSAAVAMMAAAAGSAQAGGFINQSQSTVYNGSAYAGYAAPGRSPSAMFLNPATMTEFTTIMTENNFSLVMPNTRVTGTGVFGTKGTGDQGQDALVPATYVIVPWGDLRFGLAINAPYGLTTGPDLDWGGRLNSLTTKARTMTFTPSVAYQISPQLSVGIGLQIQYMKVRFMGGSPALPVGYGLGLEGDGWGVGVTAGLTWKPFAGTSIGIGYRSRIDQPLDGSYINVPGLPGAISGIKTTVRLPDRLNLSLRQQITPQFDLLASVEWQGWSRIGRAVITAHPLAPAALPRSIPFNYRDGWFFALGGEYRYSPELTLRAGVAYEIAPVTTSIRSTRLPDNDRFWLSAGLTYQITQRLAFNASY
ncbi:MAG: OmpP1/FadL family transporter, partial [Beijerinckiaceae bacterium]